MFQTLWLFLTYTYNVILVLFIATHLFVGAIISFLTGMYIGVYLTQNYEIPRINDPRLLWEKFLSFLERNRRDPKKVSVTNLLRPSTIQELMVENEPPASSSAATVVETGAVSSRVPRAEVFTQAKSQTEMGEEDYENDDDFNMISRENELVYDDDVEGEEVSEKTETHTLEALSTSDPIKEDATTLILTEPEDLLAENFKSISSPQIVEASLTLDKNRAVSRSWTKLNL